VSVITWRIDMARSDPLISINVLSMSNNWMFINFYARKTDNLELNRGDGGDAVVKVPNVVMIVVI